MPDFQASIILREIDAQGCRIFIDDTSNYDASDEAGHERLNFRSHREIRVVRPVDSDVYHMISDNLADADTDQEIPTPEENPNLTFQVEDTWNIVNGNYQVQFLVVPQWDDAVTYSGTTLVIQTGIIYRLVAANSLNQDPSENASVWQPISFENIVAQQSTYSKYCQLRNDDQSCSVEGNTVFFETTMANGDGDVQFTLDACDSLTADDQSNFVQSDEQGHLRVHFDQYYEVLFERPNGTQIKYGVLEGADEEIQAPSAGNELSITYNLLDSDTDGLWLARICAVPSYQSNVYYNSMNSNRTVIVWHNEKLWKQVTENILNDEPSEDSTGWQEFTGDLTATRYCYTARLAMTCKSIDPCWVESVKDWVCKKKQGSCSSDLCSTEGKKYMEVRIAKDAIEIGMKNRNWELVEDAFKLALNACNCDC